ncbi:Uncharacterised protein [Mycobacteroides abscessus]|nr:Uncharacterised protein [Mycobacteroides abscessus]
MTPGSRVPPRPKNTPTGALTKVSPTPVSRATSSRTSSAGVRPA